MLVEKRACANRDKRILIFRVTFSVFSLGACQNPKSADRTSTARKKNSLTRTLQSPLIGPVMSHPVRVANRQVRWFLDSIRFLANGLLKHSHAEWIEEVSEQFLH